MDIETEVQSPNANSPRSEQAKAGPGFQAQGETRQFEAEVKEILNLMIHSLYSQKEIFLRELISNASDAMDKLRFESLTNSDWKVSEGEREILLVPDSAARTLEIRDNGIGMSADEVVKNVGTIAKSGTKEFLRARAELKEKPELSGIL